MKTPRRSGQARAEPVTDPGGWRPSPGYLAIALALAVASLVFLLKPSEEADGPRPSKAASTTQRETIPMWTPPAIAVPQAEQEVPPAAPEQHVEGDADPTRDLTFYVARGEKPTMPEVIERLQQAGVYTGLGAFTPPGTSPPLVGIAVPEDFELPPGYVRHYQTTDDGQRVEAILMYSPDFQFVDASKQPLAIPKDRVVVPEHAPPGLAIRRVEIPKPVEPQ
ncbi:hypothetical protein [Noviherbaspirillum sp.]|uniref:hypothetical protein n=1 Tax=Noviherbaspirillum sp. TaxID=1926288 RepID=UPI002D473474|nr:hypothetical protein [Noviherbaspirillum sp.]HZW19754.1 hypothetical protein [Noviherbaspirillum sp.]